MKLEPLRDLLQIKGELVKLQSKSINLSILFFSHPIVENVLFVEEVGAFYIAATSLALQHLDAVQQLVLLLLK